MRFDPSLPSFLPVPLSRMWGCFQPVPLLYMHRICATNGTSVVTPCIACHPVLRVTPGSMVTWAQVLLSQQAAPFVAHVSRRNRLQRQAVA